MKKGQKIIITIMGLVLALIILLLFTKVFKFDKKDTTKYPEVTETQIKELYELFSVKDYNNNVSFYIGNYITNNNINYSVISIVTYDYIQRTNPFKFETITTEDENITENKYELLSKINKEYFLETVKYLFGKTNYYLIDFKIDATKSAKIKDDYEYLYIYETDNKVDDNIIYYKGLESYTVENSNESIKLIEYFLKCNKTTKICYNTEGQNEVVNNKVKYSEGMDISTYINDLQKYEHKFVYENDHYRYESTNIK